MLIFLSTVFWTKCYMFFRYSVEWRPYIEFVSSVMFFITGGGEKARARHISRGKLLPRERVDSLIDPGLVHTQTLAQGALSSMVLS